MSVSSLPGLPGSPGSLSPWWRHGAILVAALGFSILSAVTVQTYRGAPPVPERVVDPCGATLFTGREILDGQEVFLRHGLMDHGTIWGHGGYLGPDYTAESLHRMAEVTQETLAAAEVGAAFASLPEGRRAAIQSETERELRRNTYDPATGTITYAPGQAAAYRASRGEWRDYFDGPAPAPGLGAHFLRDPGELEALAAYFSWATWATVAERPGTGHSYTNNFPYEPLAGNRPTSDAILWSALSLVSLLAALGAVLLAFGRFDFLGWRGEGGWRHRRHGPEPGAKTPPSHAVVPLFLGVGAVLFLLQAFA
jgi:nitric oxide reductase subunit B